MPKNSRDYVWEKMYLAVTSMCGKYSLAEGEDLKYVLRWTKHNVYSGQPLKIPDDVEHSRLVEKMLSVLLATHDES